MFQRLLGAACAVALVVSICGSASAQQPGGGRFGGGGFGGGGFGGGGDILSMPEVQKELELVEDQITKIKAINDKRGTAMREAFGGRGGGGGQQRTDEERAEQRKKIEELTAASTKEIEEVLLPHQRERYAQLRVQQSIRTRGTIGTLTSGDVSKKLGITEDQATKLREANEAIEKELQEKIAKLREETRAKLLESLSPAQREQWAKLPGEAFTFPANQGFGGQGGRGGPGGGAPGGRGGAPGGRGGAPGGGGARPGARPSA